MIGKQSTDILPLNGKRKQEMISCNFQKQPRTAAGRLLLENLRCFPWQHIALQNDDSWLLWSTFFVSFTETTRNLPEFGKDIGEG